MQNSPLVMLNNTMDVAEWGAKVSTRPHWVSAKQNSDYNIRQAKGSHNVMPKLFDHCFISIFQNTEQVHPFCISARSDYTCIGITELEYSGDPNDVFIHSDEIAYPSEVFNRSFLPSSKPTGSFGILITACSVTDHRYDSGISVDQCVVHRLATIG